MSVDDSSDLASLYLCAETAIAFKPWGQARPRSLSFWFALHSWRYCNPGVLLCLFFLVGSADLSPRPNPLRPLRSGNRITRPQTALLLRRELEFVQGRSVGTVRARRLLEPVGRRHHPVVELLVRAVGAMVGVILARKASSNLTFFAHVETIFKAGCIETILSMLHMRVPELQGVRRTGDPQGT